MLQIDADTLRRHNVLMAKRKTTVYIEEELLRAARVRAARTGKRDSEVLEEALRRYLVLNVLDRVAERADMSEDEALGIAVAEQHKMRRSAR